MHVGADYRGAWLELRSVVDDGEWQRVCLAPCDKSLRVAGSEARVSAPGMTTSNVFRIEPGRGTARFRVDGGSAKSRTLGLWTLGIGIPVALTGMGIWSYGRLEEDTAIKAVGIGTLIVGGLAIGASIPILSSGGTTVRDGKGRTIAQRRYYPAL
ncbi:MAG: hypothetical protein H6717_09070 [Polyangiaceae bacterium]|nr:hypothetical protein [Polyangiaceae bacterium]